ncbi:MAG: DNA primase [Firmicutes bacterium]|nr:DNA primase [Bacillota bacterium]
MAGNVLEEIKYKANIVDVISRVVPLKKAGTNYKACCPFHNEKTPSFMVNEDRQTYYCFGCGEHGDVIKFVEKYYNLDFKDAVKKLAEEYNVDLSNAGFGNESKFAAWYDINREAAAFYYKALRAKANPGLDYFVKRGLNKETLRTFGLGWADAEWQSLEHHFKELGTDEKTLLELGILKKGDKKNDDGTDNVYDKYRERVVFPLISTRGKVIGFSCRNLTGDPPKYINSDESAIFRKGNFLYGLNVTRGDISKEDAVIVVEGQMDVISLWQSGVKNVTASLGTALTENQAALLQRYTKNAYLCYDADAAGRKAALRGSEILYKAGFNVKVFHVTGGKDPDEYVKQYGRQAFLDLMKEALPFADYKISVLLEGLDLKKTEDNIRFLKGTAAILRELSPVEADVYIRKVASKYHISEGALRREVEDGRKAAGERSRPKYEEPAPGNEPDPKEQRSAPATKEDAEGRAAQRNLIRIMLEKSAYVPMVREYRNAFTDPTLSRILSAILSLYSPDAELDLEALFEALGPDDAAELADIRRDVLLAGRDREIFKDCIRALEKKENERRYRDILELLPVLDEDRDAAEISQLMRELMELQQKMKQEAQR